MHFKRTSLLKVLFVLRVLHLVTFTAFSKRNNKTSPSASLFGMVGLLETELQLIDNIEWHADKLQKKVNVLKKVMQELKEENHKSINNREKYLFNPLNGFALIRRMHYDWPEIEFYISPPDEKIFSRSKNENSISASIFDMVHLLEMETKYIDGVEKYAAKLQKKVNVLKNFAQNLKEENNKSINNREEYLLDPLNGFAFMNRIHNDWPQIKMYMSKPVDETDLAVIRKYRPEMPTAIDLEEASEAIYRLQTVYDLDADDLVQGVLNGKQYDAKLKSIDSYFMGYYLLNKEKFYEAGFWMYSSINSYEANNHFNTIVGFSEERPLELYAEILVAQNRPKDALSSIVLASGLKPMDAHLLRLKNHIQQLANKNDNPPIKYPPSNVYTYERGCRGEFVNKTSKMVCILNTTTTPFLRLAPLKMEILHLEPYMVLFHDVVSEQEIEHLKNLARPNLRRATVYNEETARSMVAKSRTSKFSWFQDNTDDTIQRINNRIIDMTGFDINGSEMLQIMNYGLGGHYDTHYDFFNFTADTPVVAKEGDRIATVLFYLTDVEQGGATVFPNIKTAIFPRKGSAVMWYNLNNKLDGDYLTVHAACPVIVGSKWVCNKWIRSKAQTFRKPCYK